jgi:FAD/FMN-containing dehydrogenase
MAGDPNIPPMALGRREFLGEAVAAVVDLALAEESLRAAALSRRAARALRSAVRGPVFLRRTPGYATRQLVHNTRFDGVRPDAVVEPIDTRDVQAAVRWAERFGIQVVPRSGGHSYAGYSTTARGVVVDLGRMRGIRLANGRATVGAGTQLIDVYARLARRGLVVPAGSCRSVGIAGLALGGGYGLSGRRLGLTCDNLLAATIVTADGRARRVDADTNEDLFWACRGGGGGNFGIVTSLTLQAHRSRGASWFFVRFPWSQASEALAAWQRFAPGAPPALTSIFNLSTSGGSAEPSAIALGQHYGSERALIRLIRPLSRVSGAAASTGSESTMDLVRRWAGSGGRARFRAKSDYFDQPLPPRAREVMIDWIERRQRAPSQGSGALLLDAYGGALNRPRPGATAFVHRDMLFSLQYLTYFGGSGGAANRWINGVWRALRPYASGQAYQNYIDPQLDGWQRAYYGSNLARLRDVKGQVDPAFRFRFRQAIPPS